jgi:hypothetical protein
MRLVYRPLAPGELDYELLWLSVSLGSLGLAATWLSVGLPWPQCAFHTITGHPCATCGMTRSAIQFFHGHFFAALRWNPLVFTALCGLSIFDAYAFAVVTTRAPRLRFGALTAAEKNFVRASIVTLLVVNWIYLLSHWRNF